ncbi:hypothetical protein M9458_046230, partial [Cirrhinus mrigala]
LEEEPIVYFCLCDLIGLYQIFMLPRDTWSALPMPAFAFATPDEIRMVDQVL